MNRVYGPFKSSWSGDNFSLGLEGRSPCLQEVGVCEVSKAVVEEGQKTAASEVSKKMLKDLLWNPVWKEKQAESELIGLVNGDSCEGEGWKLVTSGTIKKGPALLTDLQLQIGFSALVLGLGALSCLGRRALKSEHQGKGGDSTESGKEEVDQDGKKREISTRKALVNRVERSPPQTMHKSKKQHDSIGKALILFLGNHHSGVSVPVR